MDYFQSLRFLTENAIQAPRPESARRFAALAVVTAVTLGEVFLNIWFLVRINEQGSPEQCDSLRKELKSCVSLQRKLEKWPLRYLSTKLDLNAGAGSEFMKLKSLRNSIIHFTSSHESISPTSIAIHGLADTSDYDSLNASHAIWALETVESFVIEILRIAGVDEKEIPHALHAWLGIPPMSRQ